ncbi:La- protein 4B [Apophysomyces sp. BC1015]|nr:La- protein 4B [Apophysomyces sp. BC1015]KAG0180294.1 La- protein 4B [Apophysomyces sp. BC1021]
MESPTRDDEQDDLEIIMHDDEINASSVFGKSKAAYELTNSISDSSKQNLANDAYLVSQMDSDLYVPIATIAKFRRVREWTTDIEVIVNALRESSAVIIDETGTKVKPNISVQRTTVILRDVPDTTEEEISNLLRELESPPVKTIKKDIGNMWYITFESEDDAIKMLYDIRGKSFKGMPLAARMKSEPILRSIQPRKSAIESEKQASPTSTNVSTSPHVTPLTSPISDTSSRASDISLPPLASPYGCFYPYGMAIPMPYGNRWNPQYSLGPMYHNQYYNATETRPRYWGGYSARSKQRYGNEYRNDRQDNEKNGQGRYISNNQVNRKSNNINECRISETDQLSVDVGSVSIDNTKEASTKRGTIPNADERQMSKRNFRSKSDRPQQHAAQMKTVNNRNMSNSRKKSKESLIMTSQRSEKQNERRGNKDKVPEKGVSQPLSRRRGSVTSDVNKPKRKGIRDKNDNKGKKAKGKDDAHPVPNLQPANFPPLPTKASELLMTARNQELSVQGRLATDIVKGKSVGQVQRTTKKTKEKKDLKGEKATEPAVEETGTDQFPSLCDVALNKPALFSYADMLKKSADDKSANAD